MEFYSNTKKNENLSFTGKWMELESVILREIIQAWKAKNHISLHKQIIDLIFNVIYFFREI
jgi:hypothetical protein